MRCVLLLAVCLFVSGLLIEEAVGHGGRFRSPFPDWGRELSPVPPPPPPPAQPPLPPADGGPVAPPRVAPPAARLRPLSVDDWSFWWQLNAARYECVRWRMHYSLDGPSPFFVPGDAALDRARWSRTLVADRVLPALLRVVAPEANESPHVVASALIALGKLAEKEAHATALMRTLDVRAQRPQEVRAAAALGLGLLRRESRWKELPAGVLDRARTALFDCVEEEGGGAVQRVHAALALGLLGDQPTEGGLEGRTRCVARLLEAARRNTEDGEVGSALFRAIGHQPGEAVSLSQRAALRAAVERRKPGDRRVHQNVRAGAAFALGRIGTGEDVEVLTTSLLMKRGVGRRTQRSIAVALGRLGDRVETEDRRRIEKALMHALDRSKDDATCNLAILSLARVLVADMRSEPDLRPEVSTAAKTLLAVARKGRFLRSGFALLALGHVLHEIPGDEGSDVVHAWCEEARVVLRDASTTTKIDARLRAAALTALGMARDSVSRAHLLATFEDEALDLDVRCAAARAYGSLYEDPRYRGAKRFRQSVAGDEPPCVRRAALCAHALLGHPRLAVEETDAVDEVLENLQAADSDADRAEAILLLAHDADYRALLPLLALLEDRGRSDDTRAFAAMALGCVGDPEWMPSLDRLREGVSFRSVGLQTWRIFRLH